ncbi:MAG: hypothetical protein OEQ18_14670 [Gammaproteobacteria bacterium]|nr:hypothetical protein [Gammaproteobacteria bacterium]
MKIRSRLLIPFLISFFTLCASLQAAAATLDAKAARRLISDRMWQQKAPAGPGYIYWSWKSDGSVCLRTEDENGKCADTGRWKLDGDRLCYELTWWGASAGRKSACFRISDQGKGRYEALQDNGLTFFTFSVVK